MNVMGGGFDTAPRRLALRPLDSDSRRLADFFLAGMARAPAPNGGEEKPASEGPWEETT